MTNWCKDPARDEAVRAFEDGRSGPLPTLEEAIAGVTERRPPEPRGGRNVTPAASGAAVLAEIAASFGCEPDDDADLVEAARLLVRERDDAVAKAASGWLTAKEREAVAFAARKLCELSNRQYVNGDQDAARDTAREEGFLQSLLARSSPPEVVLEGFTPDAVRNLDTKYLAGWDQCMALAKRAILAAGVKVKEVGRE